MRTVSVNASEDSSHVSVRCSDVINSSDVKHSDSDEFKKKLPVEIQVSVLLALYYFLNLVDKEPCFTKKKNSMRMNSRIKCL